METIDALVEQLQSQEISDRFRAARALVRYKAEASPAIPYLIEALTDDSTIVRDSVVWALGAIGEDAIPALERAASDRDRPYRMMAIYALGRYTNNAPARVNALALLLKDPIPEIRSSAVQSLQSLYTRIAQGYCLTSYSLTENDKHTIR